MTFLGLKQELCRPVIAELRKTNVRYLPLSQLFELASQADASNITTFFPRTWERLHQRPQRVEGGRNYHQTNMQAMNIQYKPHQPFNLPQYGRNTPQRQQFPPTTRPQLSTHTKQFPSATTTNQQTAPTHQQHSKDYTAFIKSKPCWICDKPGHLIKDYRKRKPTGCARCGENHTLLNCPHRKTTQVRYIEVPNNQELQPEQQEGPESPELQQVLTIKDKTSTTTLAYEVTINGQQVQAIIDTGAQVSLISSQQAQQLNLIPSSADKLTSVKGANGQELKILGKCEITMSKGYHTRKAEVFIAQGLTSALILGLPWIRKHTPIIHWDDLSMTFPNGDKWIQTTNKYERIHTKDYRDLQGVNADQEHLIVTIKKVETSNPEEKPKEVDCAPELQEIIEQYEDLFKPLQGVPPEGRIQHEINLTKDAKPIMKRPYRLAEQQAKEVEQQVEKAIDEGWIQSSYSPWGTVIFVVSKKDGRWRMCVDYRDLNALTEQDAYPLPRIDDMLHKVAKAKVFTTLDLQSGYHQIWIRNEDVPKTAFRLMTPVRGSSHYEWKVMPFGLKNAPPTFQRYMSFILKDCTEYCEVYMDIIIFSKNIEEHKGHLKSVLETLRNVELKVKLSKCSFGKAKVDFLGHVLHDGQIWMQPNKQQMIINWKEPLKTAKEIRQFMGLASYYRNYIPDFATIAEPLIALTRKRSTIQWTWEVQQAFQQIKTIIGNTISRQAWDSNRRTRITTDASGTGLGAIMEQAYGSEWRTVAVWSRTLNTCQRNYSILDKEWLAILEAVTRIWKHWLIGKEFEIFTDHAPLCHILTKKAEELTPRQIRWLKRLEPFSYTIKYLKGGENVVADALSRNPQEEFKVELIEVTPMKFQIHKDEILQAIQEDALYQDILQEEILRIQLGLQYEDGILFTQEGQIYILDNPLLRYKLILEFHDQPFSGHWDERRTLQLLQRQYYWPTMNHDIHEVVSMCEPCQRAQISCVKDQAPIRYIEAQYPWEIVTIDFVSGFAMTRRKHSAICVICDRYTRMVHMESCIDHATAKDTAKIALRQIFARHGCPRIIISDRGTQFDSELWKYLWNFMGTRIHLASTHHPQTNGLTERMNRTLINMIKKMTQDLPHEWDMLLLLFEFVYNVTPNSSTGIAPFIANQGYLPATPASLLAATCNAVKTTQNVQQFITKIRKEYMKIHKHIMEQEQKNKEQIQKRWQNKRGHPQYHIGDEVLVYWPPFETYNIKPRKQRFRYEGPFKVTNVFHPHCVQLEGLPPKMPTTINVEYIHLYKQTTNPTLRALRCE